MPTGNAGLAVGVVGLGTMGLPMAANLISAGFPTMVWSRRPEPSALAAWLGANSAESPSQLGGRCGVVLTLLPDDADLREVVFASNGLVRGMRPGSLLVIMGTIDPAAARRLGDELSEHDIHVVDAPVSGGDVAARAATLSIMAGGESADIATLSPVFAALATTVHHMGGLGSGQLAKACNQVVVATTLVALGEALTLGRKSGLDPAALLAVLAGGLAGSKALEIKAEKLLSREYDPGGRAAFQIKDLAFALSAGRQVQVALPVTALVDQLFAALCWNGHGDDDHSGVIQVIELLSGIPLPPGRSPDPSAPAASEPHAT
jgi:2-hydroxy-3-oxopropionate reductase